jgi:Mg2+/Co2+ transporter CorC
MKEVRVKQAMIPIANYVTVKKEDNLVEVLQALEESRASKDSRAHRDAIVLDNNGTFIGKVTMIDIFRAVEPNYKHVLKQKEKGFLTSDFVNNALKDFLIWMEPAHSICERGSKLKVAKVMHTPERFEYIDESDTLEKAMALYVMGVHQPLIVRKEGVVTGLLRFGDVFEFVREGLLSCTE